MKVAVVGTGYVGLVTATGLAGRGHRVACVDSDPARAAAVARGEAPFHEPGLPERVRAAVAAGSLVVAPSLDDAIADSALSILAVGTPSRDGRIDLGFVEGAARDVGRALRRCAGYHVVAVRSTVVPGTTDTVVRAAVEAGSGKPHGEFGLVMNPEFLREGSALADFEQPDRIVIGHSDQRAADVMAELYRDFDCPKLFTTLRNAEMIKYAGNTLLATMISFSNELAALCESIPGLDEATVMTGLHLDRRLTPPADDAPGAVGILSYLRAGVGFGGSCLPKDVEALHALGREHGVSMQLLEAVMAVNRERPRRVVQLLTKALGGLAGKTVALLGLAFKPGTDDLRDSPALALAAALLAEGATVRAYDPVVRRVTGFAETLPVCARVEDALRDADCALIATAWPQFRTLDWQRLTAGMRRALLLDGRDVLAGVPLPASVTRLRIGVGT